MLKRFVLVPVIATLLVFPVGVANSTSAEKPAKVSTVRQPLSGEVTYEVECGDGQCLMRGTPGWRLACGNTCFIAQWRLRTYRWISGIGWQLSTSQSVTINKGAAMHTDVNGGIHENDYFGSTPNTYDVTYESNGLGINAGDMWWSSISRASWRDWRGLAHYWPCQTCPDMNDKNSTSYRAP